MSRVVIGLDIGSLTTKGILLKEGQSKASFLLPTGANAPETALSLYRKLLESVGLLESGDPYIVATGYGRVSATFAHKTITEISCHARGIVHFLPHVRTLIDVGGQDSKVVRLEKGGKVMDFLMNDKCAAGTGRFLEVMARGLEVSLPEMSRAAQEARQEVAISATCTVFAESEVVGLIARGLPKGEIARGVMAATAQRVAGMVQRLGLEEPVAMSGGVALIPAMVDALQRELGVRLLLPPEPQLIGAWGAALLGAAHA
jgi:predicted CoA-substrate-specific enzyme activase